MLFASFSYILVFLPIAIIVAIVVRKLFGPRVAQFWILLASLVFYAKSGPFNLMHLAASILANWLLGRWIERAEGSAKKRILIFGLSLNVAFLCTFKYVGFLASIIAFALPRSYTAPSLGLPLGISFFTITQIMYLVDCYEGLLTAGTLFDHATFVAFFPYLISGPLARAKRMRFQFDHFGGLDGKRWEMISRGLFLFSLGLFKKAALADSFARVGSYGYSSATHLSALEAWIFSIAYMMEIYFDFSGYSDMAIGSALMLGIDVPPNFDAPYGAKSIIEFWQRWHISLTNFITTYLYTPILRAFKKKTLIASTIATFVAMGIAGLWHGPAWTFVVFGLLHGACLAINQVWRKKKMPRIPPFASWLLTFTLVMIGFIYFGAGSLGQGTARLISLFNPHQAFTVRNLAGLHATGFSVYIFGLPMMIGAFVSLFGPSSEESAREFSPTALNCAWAIALSAIALVFVNSNIPTPFVYFRF